MAQLALLYPIGAEELLTRVRTVTPKTVVWLGKSQYYLGGANRLHQRSATFCATRRLPAIILGGLLVAALLRDWQVNQSSLSGTGLLRRALEESLMKQWTAEG